MVDETTEVQWRVVWFPADAPDRTFVGTEAAVRRKAASVAEWHPFIECREVVVKAWEPASP